jgi:uncharacterized protein YecE (DUF72 family)
MGTFISCIPGELAYFEDEDVTHEKMLMDCEVEFDEFVDRMQILDSKLGPLLLQFPLFNKSVLEANEFLRRLTFLLARLKDSPVRFVVEIRNKTWLTERLLDVLRENRFALALSDTSFMPRPWEQKLDLITTDFVYVRWLGDREGIERENNHYQGHGPGAVKLLWDSYKG